MRNLKIKLNFAILIMGLFSLFSCGQKNKLTQIETDLLNKLDFKTELLIELKDLTKTELKQLPAIEEETADVIHDKFYNGLYSETTEDKAIEFVQKLKLKFRENGYLIFVFEGEDDKKSVAVIKGQDELDILRFRRTNGLNYNIENEDIVRKMVEWKAKYGLNIIGCSRDWLQVEFENMPTDLEAFSKEVYEFCPDSVDQGVGTIEKLKKTIKQMKGIWLWWD